MGGMRLWAAKNASGTNVLFRGEFGPEFSVNSYYKSEISKIIANNDNISNLATSGLKPCECREIKSIDLINWTVEYAPEPPTLKEAWKRYRSPEISYSEGSPFGQLIEALQREFPDE